MLRRVGLLLVVLSVIVTMAACGGSGGGGTPPSIVTGVSVSCSPSTIGSGQTSQCSATVTGTGGFSSAVTWSSSAGPGSISTTGVLTAPIVTTSTMVTVTATSNQNTGVFGTFTVTVNPQAAGANVAPLVVDAGPPQLNPPAVNIPFTTVTVCVPNTTTCQTIDHVTVDTGSSGLRLVSSVLTITLPPETDPNNNNDPFGECLVFLDGYIWGNVVTADVTVGGEKASGIPVHVIIPQNASPSVPGTCSSQNPSGGAGNEGGTNNSNSVDTFGANGLIGVGTVTQDCGSYCVSQGSSCNGTSQSPCLYYDCPPSGCTPANIALSQQIPNPIIDFPVDNNGVLVELPSVPDGGSPTVTGTLVFGIDTESNNQLGGATVYELDSEGNFTTHFNGNTYTESFVDSGSNTYFFNDSNIAQCGSENPGWYCPNPSPVNLSASNQGTNMNSPVTQNFMIENADTLFSTGNTAFSTLAAPYPGTPVEFDWGLPFFFGRNVFTAIDGASVSGGTGPFVAF